MGSQRNTEHGLFTKFEYKKLAESEIFRISFALSVTI